MPASPEEMKLCCFNDDWTLEVEKLGYKELADNVKMLLYHALPPFSAAVCGGWGSGKTSVLRYLMASTGGRRLYLDPETVFFKTTKDEAVESYGSGEKEWKEYAPQREDDHLPSVWFNPWQHQFEDHPVKALLHEIYNQFSTWGKMKKEGGKMVNVLLNTGLRILKDLKLGPLGISLDAGAIQQAGEAYEKKHFMDPLDSQRFSIAFEQAVAHLATAFKHRKSEGNNEIKLDTGARVVIFIDDLDRCQGVRAFKLLEAIKLFLNTRHCIFVFGIDYHRLIKDLSRNVPEFDKDENQAGDYLDKMFQALVPLPLPKEEKFNEFIHGLGVPAPLSSQVEVLASILERNPRKAKNFINSLMVQMSFTGVFQNEQIEEDETKRHVLMHYLRYYYPDVYRVLEKAQQPKAMNDLLAVCEDEAGKSNIYRFFNAKMKNELPGDLFEAASSADQSIQLSDMPLDMENMDQHVDTFRCRQQFKGEFAASFSGVSDPTPYL